MLSNPPSLASCEFTYVGNEFVVVPHKLRPVGSTMICTTENGKDVPHSMLEESVKGIVNRRPNVTPSHYVSICERDQAKFLSHMAIIWLLIRPGSLFCFYGSIY